MSTATTTVPIRRELERDPIFIKDDKFYTTAGVSAGSIRSTENRDRKSIGSGLA
jgi:hypothetical protein